MNVLPPEAKGALLRTIRARFLLTGSIVLGFAALTGFLALLPAYFLAHAPQAALSAQSTQQETTSETKDSKVDRESAQRTRILLTELSSLAQSNKSASETIAGIYALRPPGVTVSSIVYTAGKTGTITISGMAPTRDVINAYRTALSASSRFDNVSVPVAALVGALDGRFTITLTGAF